MRHNSKHDTLKVKTKNYALILLPVITSTPATGLQYGIAGQIAFTGKSADSRTSLISMNALYTTKQQAMFLVKNNVYLKKNRIFLSGDWKLMLYSQTTYGLGTNAPGDGIKYLFSAYGSDVTDDSLAQPMKYNYTKFYQNASFIVAENLFVGGGVHLDSYYQIEDEKLDTANKIYTSHYAYNTYHDLNTSEYLLSGLCANVLYDSRDNLVNPYKGLFANLSFWLNPKFLGSDTESSFISSEFRYFHPVSKNNQRNILAFWFLGNFTTYGTIPYMVLPALGYDQRSRSGRGYSQGRFRGQDLVYLESEFRFNISPCSKILGGVVFANAISTSNRDFDVRIFDYIRPGYGVGIRLMADKKTRTNLQLDFGFGNKSSGLYLGATETF